MFTAAISKKQDTEWTQMFINKEMNKQNVVYTEADQHMLFQNMLL